MIIGLAICAGLATAFLLFKPFFNDCEKFGECIRYWLTPDIVSMIRGEWAEDQWASMKLFLYVGLSIGSGILTAVGLHKLFG